MNQPQRDFLPVNAPPPPILLPGGRIVECLLAEVILSGDPEAGQDTDPAFAGLAGQWHAEGSHQMAPVTVPGDSTIYHIFSDPARPLRTYPVAGRLRIDPDKMRFWQGAPPKPSPESVDHEPPSDPNDATEAAENEGHAAWREDVRRLKYWACWAARIAFGLLCGWMAFRYGSLTP